ncbi:hypothetical protein BC938DRAFT_480987 [Jimgerdemannia flammicorona]|uniref:GED domain-containing protein n=1 Tax=Jimgerdemannia flammicorona TaxID=994334 RepID=A0A433QH81_9FUNG|nr:hypothetical protein BC938DRAFT_480987 [Jimgerdemannia flammicorona]
MEQGHPFTSNDEDLATFQTQFEQRARIIIDSEISTGQDDTRVSRSVAPEVMTIMAGVAGYSKIAQQRIIDNIPMTIDTKLLKEFGERVQPMLVKQLGLLRSGGDLDVAILMVENAELASQRQKLLGQQDTLLEIRKDVIKFGI